MIKVLETTRNVVEESRYVRIDRQALTGFSRKLLEDRIKVPEWDRHYHLNACNEEMVSYLLVLDSLNFCFWPAEGSSKWEIDYGSVKLSGYYALAASIKLGILRYSQGLAKKVDQKVLIEAGSAEEVEIRANTLWAVELIRQELCSMEIGLRAFEIDWILWNVGQGEECRVKPYHRTLTIFY